MTIEQLEQEVARMQASGMYTQEQIESYIIQNAPNENDLGIQRQDTDLFGRSSSMPIQPVENVIQDQEQAIDCLLYTSPSPRDVEESRMPSSA